MSSGFYLLQQNQDLRQQASENGCTINGTASSCNAIAGCEWKTDTKICSMDDCNSNNPNCEYTPAGESNCSMTNCFAYSSCKYIAPVKESCATFTNQGSCSPSGCSWQTESNTLCTMADCTAGKTGCTIVTPKSNCTLSNCFAYSTCSYTGPVAEKKASCSTFTNQGTCSPGGCWWQESKTNCSMSDCNAGKSGCWIQAAQTTPCTMSNCFAYPSSCTYKAGTTTAGYCSGPSGCSAYSESTCKSSSYKGCGWTPGTTTASSCSGIITLQAETCNGQYVTGGSCNGEYTSVPAKAAKCEGQYVSGAAYCTGQYYSASKCSGTYTKVPEKCEGTYVSGSPSCNGNYEVGSCTGEPTSDSEPFEEKTAECYFGITSCPSGTVQSAQCNAQSCPSSSAICCKPTDEEVIDNCTQGNSYCPYSSNGYSTQVNICKPDKSGYDSVDCESGKVCPVGEVGCKVVKAPITSTCSELGASCCFDDKEGTLSCSDGLIPNSEDPSSCKCRLPYNECTAGQKSCDGNTVQTCSSQGKWLDFTECSNRCSQGECIENLADGSICSNNADCASNNCQNVPGSKACVPAGQSFGVVKAGETCGTNSYDTKCEDGYICSQNICLEIKPATALAGDACEYDRDCVSDKCELTEYGWKACAAVATKVALGNQCGTDEFNQECEAPYLCLNYICRLPVEITTPFEEYLEENQGLLSPDAETPGWGEAGKYIAASTFNSAYNIADTIFSNPGDTGTSMAKGMAEHFSNLWDQALCADYRYAKSETCKNLTWYEKTYVGVNLVTLGGFEQLVSLYNTSGRDAMMNVNGYEWNDPRRWADNAELGIAVTGFAEVVVSPFINPASFADAPISSTYDSLNNINKNDIFDSVFEKLYNPRATIASDNSAIVNHYQQLLDKAQTGVTAGLSPEQAVQEALIKSGSSSNSGLSNTLLGPIKGDTTLAQQVCLGQANCVGQALVGNALLEDLGSTSKVIYGTGGKFPYVHAALETPSGIIPYAAKDLFNYNQFEILAERFKWGNYVFEGLAQ